MTVTDANNCTATAEATVDQPVTITAAATATDALCNEAANGQVDLIVAGGTAPYTFLWSNGATTEDLTDLTAGTYSVTVTDANNCTATAEATVDQPVTDYRRRYCYRRSLQRSCKRPGRSYCRRWYRSLHIPLEQRCYYRRLNRSDSRYLLGDRYGC